MSSWHIDPWQGSIDWETSSGKFLQQVLFLLDQTQPRRILLFGSAPLQMAVDKTLFSNDIDMLESPGVEEILSRHRLLKGQSEPYIEICDGPTFTASTDWQDRAHTEKVGNIEVVFPHPIDILVSKVKRMAEKDFSAFERVRAITGHPTEDEMIAALRRVVDMYRPSFDEEAALDPIANTRLLFQRIYGRDINVREEIIAPALRSRAKAYSLTPESQQALNLLREASGTPI